MADRSELSGLPPPLRAQVAEYFAAEGVDQGRVGPADVVLALLRINSPTSLAAAERLVGRPIQSCPPCVPPWPPRPPAGRQRAPRVSRVGEGKLRAEMAQRFTLVRVGMTRDQLLLRGVRSRDLLQWARDGLIEWR